MSMSIYEHLNTFYHIFYFSAKNELVEKSTSADVRLNTSKLEAPTTSLVESVSFSFTVPIKVIILI